MASEHKVVRSLDEVIEHRAKSMVLSLSPEGKGTKFLNQLHDVLLPHREGSCYVAVQYVGTGAEARLNLGSDWTVRPSRELRDKLTELLGRNSVRMIYTPDRQML